jgi:hypothetical protein
MRPAKLKLCFYLLLMVPAMNAFAQHGGKSLYIVSSGTKIPVQDATVNSLEFTFNGHSEPIRCEMEGNAI